MTNKNPLLIAAAVVIFSGSAVTALRASTAASKGYVIAEITVTDSEAYQTYVAAVGPVVAHFSGKYLVRGGQTIAVEGDAPTGRFVVIEFDSLEAAQTFQNSPQYQAIAPLRHKSARSRVFLVEGVPPR
jgi:uncharacterized protein (DUF1330 family)